MTHFAEKQNMTEKESYVFSKNKDIAIEKVPGFMPYTTNGNLYFSENNGYIVNIQEIENPSEWGVNLTDVAETLNGIHIRDIQKYGYNTGDGFKFLKNAFNATVSIEYSVYLTTVTNELPEGNIIMKMIDVYFEGNPGTIYQMIICTPWVINDDSALLHEKVQECLMRLFSKFASSISKSYTA